MSVKLTFELFVALNFAGEENVVVCRMCRKPELTKWYKV